MPEEIITTEQTETSSVSSILNYRAITKEAIYPTRNMGMGKILIEIVDVYLLTNRIILRDWVIIYDENNNIIHKEIINDNYVKTYTDEQFSQMFISANVNFSDMTLIYRKLKEVADITSLLINQVDPPYGLAPNSFEKFVGTL
jgi:hypothetical protein